MKPGLSYENQPPQGSEKKLFDAGRSGSSAGLASGAAG